MNNNIMNDLLEKAKKMKDDMEKIKEDLGNNLQVTGESGGGLVKITLNGKYDVHSINIDPSILVEKKEVIEELIAGAFNNATEKVRQASQEKLSELTKGLNLPDNMDMPF